MCCTTRRKHVQTAAYSSRLLWMATILTPIYTTTFENRTIYIVLWMSFCQLFWEHFADSSWLTYKHVHTLHNDRGISLRLNGIGLEVILPMIDFKDCQVSSFSLWNVNRSKRLLNTRKSSIFTSGSPKHVLGPKNNVNVVHAKSRFLKKTV